MDNGIISISISYPGRVINLIVSPIGSKSAGNSSIIPSTTYLVVSCGDSVEDPEEEANNKRGSVCPLPILLNHFVIALIVISHSNPQESLGRRKKRNTKPTTALLVAFPGAANRL